MQLKTMPDYSKLGLNDIMSYKGSVAQDTERAHAHDHAATLYNHVSGLCHFFPSHEQDRAGNEPCNGQGVLQGTFLWVGKYHAPQSVKQ